LLIALQRSRFVRLGSQSLDRGTHSSLVSIKSLTNGGEVVDVFRHHVDHIGKHHE
jgi:hypothetical protein